MFKTLIIFALGMAAGRVTDLKIFGRTIIRPTTCGAINVSKSDLDKAFSKLANKNR